MLYAHDIRDWAQRHAECHAFFVDKRPMWRDLLWQLHCDMRLTHPPRFGIEESVARDLVYRFMQQTWMLQQIPWALLCFLIGSWPFVVWGISVRVTLFIDRGIRSSVTLAHNVGRRDWSLDGHAVQGFNVPGISLLTMGEAWHNNHHAFPGSARLGLRGSQFDPGWWMLVMMRAFITGLESEAARRLAGRARIAGVNPKRSAKTCKMNFAAGPRPLTSARKKWTLSFSFAGEHRRSEQYSSRLASFGKHNLPRVLDYIAHQKKHYAGLTGPFSCLSSLSWSSPFLNHGNHENDERRERRWTRKKKLRIWFRLRAGPRFQLFFSI